MNYVSTPAIQVTETCGCGAAFTISGFSVVDLEWMVRRFRDEHAPCRVWYYPEDDEREEDDDRRDSTEN